MRDDSGAYGFFDTREEAFSVISVRIEIHVGVDKKATTTSRLGRGLRYRDRVLPFSGMSTSIPASSPDAGEPVPARRESCGYSRGYRFSSMPFATETAFEWVRDSD